MTIASEAVIAAEVGLRYAAVVSVDNLANGIAPQPLSIAEYEAGKAANRERAQHALARVIPALADPPAGAPGPPPQAHSAPPPGSAA
jgi:5'-methylthioadenosine phosphorylase